METTHPRKQRLWSDRYRLDIDPMRKYRIDVSSMSIRQSLLSGMQCQKYLQVRCTSFFWSLWLFHMFTGPLFQRELHWLSTVLLSGFQRSRGALISTELRVPGNFPGSGRRNKRNCLYTEPLWTASWYLANLSSGNGLMPDGFKLYHKMILMHC